MPKVLCVDELSKLLCGGYDDIRKCFHLLILSVKTYLLSSAHRLDKTEYRIDIRQTIAAREEPFVSAFWSCGVHLILVTTITIAQPLNVVYTPFRRLRRQRRKANLFCDDDDGRRLAAARRRSLLVGAVGLGMETEPLEPTSRCPLFNKIYAIFFRLFCLPQILRFFKSAVADSELLHIHIPNVGGRFSFGRIDKREPVDLYLVNPVSFCLRIMLDQRIGLGESYMAGDWNASPTPHAFLHLLIRSRKENGKAPLNAKPRKTRNWFTSCCLNALQSCVRLFNYIRHCLRTNSITGSAKNIREHYDLGNDMFKLFLDQTMTYSSGIFTDFDLHQPVMKFDRQILFEAQLRKYDRIIDLLQISRTDHVLEIGCGWGACAVRAVQRTGCQWTGLTISKEQYELARNCVIENGLCDRIEIKCLDYRLEKGKYDRIVSIEMIEAVGHKFLPVYFNTIRDCLKAGGKACLQAITIPNSQYDRYRKSSDFIKKHIFPGGHMPCESIIEASLPTDLHIRLIEHIGLHYVPTLDHWYRAWMQHEASIMKLGYSESFHRKWQYYFALCSSLFAYSQIDNLHIVLQRDGDDQKK